MTTLEQILKRPPVAQDAPTRDRWKAVEEQLGTRLPQDYKSFVEAFGVGTINRFLVVLTPMASNEYVDLLRRGRTELDAFETSKREFPTYYIDNVYPTRGGILPFAVTDNGEILYWRTVGSPEEWTVTVYEARGPEHCDFHGGMAEFLAAVLTGKFKCNVLPRGFVKSQPTFKPIKVSNQ